VPDVYGRSEPLAQLVNDLAAERLVFVAMTDEEIQGL
jgi:hypothetical protein